MKINFKIVIALLFLISSCSKDELRVSSTTQISSETFWKTESDLKLALNGIYSSLGSLQQSYIYYDALTDNAYNHYPWEGFKAIADGTQDTRNPGAISWVWNDSYQGIGRANTLLDNIELIEGLNQDLKNYAIGEALFLRAYFYFTLSDLYGGVPMPLESPKVEHGELPREPKEKVIEQILQDLDKAADLLPQNQDQVGKATRGAALGLKTRVLLFNKKWTEATITAKEVMQMGYGLYPNYRELFLQENENNLEVIFDVQYKAPEQGNFYQLYLGGMQYGGWSSIVPLSDLADAYLMEDGLTQENSPLYNPENPYENRDPRLKQTVFVPGATVNGIENHEDDYTGFTFKKYTPYDEDKVVEPIGYPNTTGGNAIILRYADILLMYAEAQNEAVGPDQSVYDAINAVRTRPSVNMPPVEPGLSQEEMRQVIRLERRVEFVLEASRYSDLRRWGIAENELDGLQDPGGVRKFDPNRDYLWPIPGAEFDIDGNQLEQNPGY